jgi:hypothetical protein
MGEKPFNMAANLQISANGRLSSVNGDDGWFKPDVQSHFARTVDGHDPRPAWRVGTDRSRDRVARFFFALGVLTAI